MLEEVDLQAARDTRLRGQERRGADDEVGVVGGHVAAQRPAGGRRQPPGEVDAESRAGRGARAHDEPVGERDRHHQRLDLVEAVVAPGEHGEREIELGGGRHVDRSGARRGHGAAGSAASRIGPVGMRRHPPPPPRVTACRRP